MAAHTARNRQAETAAVARAGRVAAEPEFDLIGRGMAQWRHERPDIDCSGKAVVGRILHLQDIILRAVNATLAQHGLRYPAYAVLATLRASGAPFRMSPSRLQATMLFTSGGVSNMLRRLEAQGLVCRAADPADGRGTIVELTAKGLALADAAMADHAGVERRLAAMLSGAEQDILASLLSRMILFNGAAPIDLGPAETGTLSEK
ncbi:MarR family winged helix-turn-helix transcriptional regulator [Limobrevibacterium gyesilva]|uniref:MarR family winged helix-turn-helix transcriptional regulator n=1 Tax=Limobrevibacterium gyesilva TaxID=2991712 RepID=A0AA42CIE9_9PROT|nr:MarR family winged helix-turn-helix transcriptional regulator [Limobrevibacterium gyesilva]MCW3475862.1 MarR family winged helix-turn-helix transcriptional regulator [Limobrevibacterium gyesilva]